MFFLGHLGIGLRLSQPWSKKLPLKWILFGAILSDVIDKPLYYLLSWSTGLKGAELGLISGTRTFGHTGILLVILGCVTVLTKSKRWAALTLGLATHLLLDGVTDYFMFEGATPDEPSSLIALLYPFLGFRFGVMPFKDFSAHIGSKLHPFIVGSELLGLFILLYEDWKRRNHRSILFKVRHLRKLRKRGTQV